MKLVTIKKGVSKNWKSPQKKRLKNILNLIRPDLKRIKADDLCTEENAHQILMLSGEISKIHLKLSSYYETCPILEKFRTANHWYLLHLVNLGSVTGRKIYKETLVKENLLSKSSAKTIYKMIDDMVAEGLFIEMPEYTEENGTQNGYKNLRPSEELTAAYLRANIKSLIDNLTFLQEHTKISIKFNLEDQ